MKSIKAALYYEFKNIFNSITLADIQNWDKFIERLVNIALEVMLEKNGKNKKA